MFGWLSRSGDRGLSEILAGFLSNAAQIRLESSGDALTLFAEFMRIAAVAVVPVLLIFTIAGITSSVLQNKPSLVWKRVAPDFSRVSPASGLKRMTGGQGLIEFVKTTIRFWAMAGATVFSIYAQWDVFQAAASTDPRAIASTGMAAASSLSGALAAISALFLVLDLPVAHLLWRRSLRMAPNEIKDERKQSEGDPHIKARRLGIARKRIRRKLIRDVSRATLVVANPTHFAVALRYEREEGGAPRVVAKGQDLVALTIRRLAEEKGIPVVENKALARSLYKKVTVDQMIPVEFYRVIAEILIKLQSRKADQ